jgi:hypothetical protein
MITGRICRRVLDEFAAIVFHTKTAFCRTVGLTSDLNINSAAAIPNELKPKLTEKNQSKFIEQVRIFLKRKPKRSLRRSCPKTCEIAFPCSIYQENISKISYKKNLT